MLRGGFQISRVFNLPVGLLKTTILLKTNTWSRSSVHIYALFIIVWIIKWRMKRVCWEIITYEALCSMGKKVCYINYFHQQNLGCYLSKNLFVHAIKGKPDKMSVIYWPLSDDSIMDSGTWQSKAVVKFFLEDVHWLGSISAISWVRSLIPLGGWVRAHFPEQGLVIEPIHWPTDNVVSISQFLYCV